MVSTKPKTHLQPQRYSNPYRDLVKEKLTYYVRVNVTWGAS